MGDFLMPSLGADMEAGTLIEWKVKPGDGVKRGDLIAVVETDKGLIDIEIWEGGVVDELRVAPGTKVPVGTVLAVVRGAGEAAVSRPAPSPAPPVPAPSPAPSPVPSPAPPAPGPSVEAAASGPAPPARGHPRASPAARALARELSVDLAGVLGSGPEGAVTVADVEAAARRAAHPAPPPAEAIQAAPAAPATPPIRQAIAAAMARSNREIPHYYLGSEIDLSRALGWLAAENQRRPVPERLLPAVLLLKAVARAAREVPELNGFFTDGAFRPAAGVHLGVAISLRQGGLVAPALHDVDQKPLGVLMRELEDLVARTRRGGLRSSELTDATLTVTNLGDLGVATVYGVIYPPQVALVGFGRVRPCPWASDGQVEVRPVISATLAGDHRVSDGIRGARFLAAVDRQLQAPEGL